MCVLSHLICVELGKLIAPRRNRRDRLGGLEGGICMYVCMYAPRLLRGEFGRLEAFHSNHGIVLLSLSDR